MRKTIWFSLVVAITVASTSSFGQDQRAELQRKLDSLFTLTRVTADNSDIVTPGSILVLHVSGLQMVSTQAKLPLTNIYKNGKLSSAKLAWSLAMGIAQPDTPSASIPVRQFVPDEKFWVTGISAEKYGVVMKIYSDPYQDVRYYAQLEIPYNKKAMPSDDELLKSISELVTVDAQQEPVPTAEPADGQSVTKPIQPPAPPPKTISLGQTKDEVLAVLGQPNKVANVGTKEIDYYPDMKVIYVNGKVADIQ